MRGRPISYTPAQLAWVKARRSWPRKKLHPAFVKRFRRRDVTLDALKQLCTRNGWLTGRDGRFKKGGVPANKGTRCPEGKGGRHPNARRTQFKPGCRRGRANMNYKPIGTERLSKEGYLERKIHDGLPMQSRWRAVHLIRWEEQNGPIPEGHCLKCLDGNRLNTDPSNWALLPRAALGILNRAWNGVRYDEAPPELRPTLIAIAQLKAAASSQRRAAPRG